MKRFTDVVPVFGSLGQTCHQLGVCAGEGSRQLNASTRQAALVTVAALGDALGPSHPKPFIAVLPALVAAAKDVHRSVRSSALAAAASCLAALGSAALPLLPKLVPAVLAAAQTAVDGLGAPSHAQSQVLSCAEWPILLLSCAPSALLLQAMKPVVGMLADLTCNTLRPMLSEATHQPSTVLTEIGSLLMFSIRQSTVSSGKVQDMFLHLCRTKILTAKKKVVRVLRWRQQQLLLQSLLW